MINQVLFGLSSWAYWCPEYVFAQTDLLKHRPTVYSLSSSHGYSAYELRPTCLLDSESVNDIDNIDINNIVQNVSYKSGVHIVKFKLNKNV